MADDLINRQAAIDAVLADVDDVKRPNTEVRWWNMGLTRASEILKQLPSAQPERCEDCRNFNKARLLIPQPERS